jgi:hypothetical protein
MLESILEQLVGKCIEYCEKKENMERLETRLLVPIIRHISTKFAWLRYSFQTVVILVLLQTCLVIYMLFKIHSLHALRVQLQQ